MDPFRPSRVSFTCKYDFAFLGFINSNGSGAKRGNFAIFPILAQIGVLEPSVDCKKAIRVLPEVFLGGFECLRPPLASSGSVTAVFDPE